MLAVQSVRGTLGLSTQTIFAILALGRAWQIMARK